MSLFNLRNLVVPAIVAVATIASPALAQEQTLKVGSNAPALSIGNWAQGEVKDLNDPNTTYVVEFWATWCGPCKQSIPHINALYKKLHSRGLVVVGVSDEPLATVKPFVTKMGSEMSYNVACDQQDKRTTQDWMQAAKQNGIPCAFVVRKGKIVWIGHPMDKGFESAIEGSLTGRYNPELTKQAQPTIRAANEAVRVKNFKDAWKHFDTVIAIDPQVFGDIAVRKYKVMLVDAKDTVGARAWGEEVIKKYSTDSVTLGELAKTIAISDGISPRDFDLAIQAADAAGKLAKSGDAPSLALRAEILYAAGKFNDAKELQYEAWMAADPSEKADYLRVLDNYKKVAAKAKAGA